MKNQRGFTLLELMIVVSIIGILSAIAIPSYQDYLKRMHVLEGVSLMSSAKFAVYEYRYHHGIWPNNNTAANLPVDTSITADSTRSVTVNNGRIIITYRTNVGSGQTLVFTPTMSSLGSIEWGCNMGSTIPAKYRPPNCRQ